VRQGPMAISYVCSPIRPDVRPVLRWSRLCAGPLATVDRGGGLGDAGARIVYPGHWGLRLAAQLEARRAEQALRL